MKLAAKSEKKSRRNFGFREIHRQIAREFERLSGVKLQLIFVLGQDKGELSVEKTLAEEILENHDILIGDFIDSYQNLTLKIFTIHHFAKNNFDETDVKWFVIQDEDTFLDYKRNGSIKNFEFYINIL